MERTLKIILLILIGLLVSVLVSPDTRQTLSTAFKSIISYKYESNYQPLSNEEVTALIQENIHYFAVALQQKDMSTFYVQLSEFWQEKTSVGELNQIFKPFIDAGIDLGSLKKSQPVMDVTPQVTNKADLQVSGHYTTKPFIVHFKQTYTLEHTGEWKLVEFFMDIKNP